MLERLNQTLRLASRDESIDQTLILIIEILDHHCRWKCGAYVGDYPLCIAIYMCGTQISAQLSCNVKFTFSSSTT